MINSILEKRYNRIILDRVQKKMTQENGDEVESLVTDEQEVKKETASFFSKIFRQRDYGFDKISEEWKQIYDPREDINSEIYDNLDKKPTEDEWDTMLSSLNLNSAAGISGIGYRLIKKCNPLIQKLFRNIAGLCYETATVPEKWKFTQLYPIPKNDDWNYDLAFTRPILLIECLRKCTVKIVMSRLGNCLKKHQILKGPNFAGLPGKSTHAPLHILNNIMEDARETGKPLWLISQDMAKAFDSVGMLPLEKALNRIKIPVNIKDFILDIYKNRSIKIITSYGLTEAFVAGDGIDQGEAISPLIWRIFYNPLLHRIQEDTTLGYEMKINWPLTQQSSSLHRQSM